MRRPPWWNPGRLGLWWLPILLLGAPLFGLMPGHRDISDYFLPIRMFTASLLRGGDAPWLNWFCGCGEAWFANPQTGVLYPPTWVWLLIQPHWALSLEVAAHLCWLALGAGLVAVSFGAGRPGRLVAEAGVITVGPVLATIGVMNNLEALAWTPWMVLAARRTDQLQIPLLAVATALGWLAAEPQLWALGVALTVVAAHRRVRAAAGIGLGVALVAVQLLPFVGWVVEGDRGPGASAAAFLAGSIPLRGWLGLLVPGLAPSSYVESLFIGAPILVLAVLGMRRLRLVAGAALALALLATLPAVGGESLYLVLTGRLVRYPSRFAVVACALVLLLAACGAEPWSRGRGRWIAVVLGGGSVAAALAVGETVGTVAAVLLGGMLLLAGVRPESRVLRWLPVGATFVIAAWFGWGLIDLRDGALLTAPPRPWPSFDRGRVYSPPPPTDALPRLSADPRLRTAWPIGYGNLLHGRRMVRTFAPIADSDLAEHLAEADGRTNGRWWVDSSGARWVVRTSPSSAPGLVVQNDTLGLWLHRNRRAWPIVMLLQRPPRSDASPTVVSGLVCIKRSGPSLIVATDSPSVGWLNLAVTPSAAWRWTVDDRVMRPRTGPGVSQGVVVPPGRHVVRVRYYPPGLGIGLTLSVSALLLAAWLVFRGRREPGGST